MDNNPTNNATDNLVGVIAKVQKLLSLAKNNSSKNEMEAATRAADKLIQEHRISQAQLESAGKTILDPMGSKCVHSGGRRTNWRETILWALTKHYGCVWYFYKSYRNDPFTKKQTRLNNYHVVGRQSDTEIVDYMFNYITDAIERLCKLHSLGNGVGYAKSWLEGAAAGVSTQFKQLQEETKKIATSSAMVLLDNRNAESKSYYNDVICKGGKNKKGAAISGARSSYNAHQDGFAVGKNIPLNKGPKE